MHDLLIHIGHQKTGTTWLQNVLFNNPSSGLVAPWGGQSVEAMEHFVMTNAFAYDPSLVRQQFLDDLAQTVNPEAVPIISHEDLAGDQIKGNYWAKPVADRIYATFPEAKILLMIREQKSMIASTYRQSIKGGGTEKLADYLGATVQRRGFRPTCRLDGFAYDLIVDYYQQHFGRDRVLVIPFERLKRDQQSVLQDILSFAGITTTPQLAAKQQSARNVGYRGLRLAFQRRLNYFAQPAKMGAAQSQQWRWACRIAAALNKPIPAAVNQKLEQQQAQFIQDVVGTMYAQSNHRTSELIGIDLKTLGYD